MFSMARLTTYALLLCIICPMIIADKKAYLKTAHRNSPNPGFSEGDCPTSPDNYQYGWHFILKGTTSSFTSINCTFENAGTTTKMVQQPSNKHAYVFTPTSDVLVDAWATINGSENEFVLSHVCSPRASINPTTVASSPSLNQGNSPSPATITTTTTTTQYENDSTTMAKRKGDDMDIKATKTLQVDQSVTSSIREISDLTSTLVTEQYKVIRFEEANVTESEQASTINEVENKDDKPVKIESRTQDEDFKDTKTNKQEENIEVKEVNSKDEIETATKMDQSNEISSKTNTNQRDQDSKTSKNEGLVENKIVAEISSKNEAIVVTNKSRQNDNATAIMSSRKAKTATAVKNKEQASQINMALELIDNIPRDDNNSDDILTITAISHNSTQPVKILSNRKHKFHVSNTDHESNYVRDVAIDTLPSQYTNVNEQQLTKLLSYLIRRRSRIHPSTPIQKLRTGCLLKDFYVNYIYEHDIHHQRFNSSFQDLNSSLMQRLQADIAYLTAEEVYKRNMASDITASVQIIQVLDVTKQYHGLATIRYYLAIAVRKTQIPVMRHVLSIVFEKLQKDKFTLINEKMDWNKMVMIPLRK